MQWINTYSQHPEVNSTKDRSLQEIVGPLHYASKVSEIVGPPGSGKTHVALQVCASIVKKEKDVLWIACKTAFPRSTFEKIGGANGRIVRTIYIPTLVQLIVFLVHQFDSKCQDLELGVVVIDDFASVFNLAFSETGSDKKSLLNSKNQSSVIATVVTALRKIALTKKIPILLVNQMRTHITDQGAMLVPAMGE